MKKAFTLLEMLVVVIIVSILFLLCIPNVSKVISSVDDKACLALSKVVDSAIVQFKLEYGQMPRAIEDLINAGLIDESQSRCSSGSNLYIEDGHCVIE